jgi:adenylate kinase
MKRATAKRQEPFNLILLGDPGAGKATQGAKLVKKYPFLREFDFGVWLRAVKEPELKNRLGKTTHRGHLAPGDVAKMMFRKVIFTTPKNKGVFFNGNPRAVGEAKMMLKWFKEVGRPYPLVIYIRVTQKEMLQRLKKRGRFDDAAAQLKNRMSYYRRNVKPTFELLKTRCHTKEISGLGTRQEVFRRLVTEIENLRAKSER